MEEDDLQSYFVIRLRSHPLRDFLPLPSLDPFVQLVASMGFDDL